MIIRSEIAETKKPKTAIMRIALTVLVLAAPPAYAAGNPSELRKGRLYIEKACSSCHSIDRSGNSPHPDAPAFRTLSRRYPLGNLEEALAEGIATGHPDMPEFQFSPEEIANIIQYLNTIQQRPAR